VTVKDLSVPAVTGFYIHRVSKNKQNYFCYNYVTLPPNLTIFGTMMANCLTLGYMRCTHFPPHLTHVNALPCRTQIVT